MKGLIYKDLLNMKTYVRTIILIAVMYVAISILTDGGGTLASMLVFIFAFFPIATFSYDNYSKWDNYSTSFPITRDKIVLSRYLVSILFSVIGVILYLAVIIAVSLKTGNPITQEGWLQFLAMVSSSLLFTSVLMPVVYKWGVDKGRIVLMAAFILIFIAVFLLGRLNMLPEESIMLLVLKLLPVVAAFALLISFALSISIFRRREL